MENITAYPLCWPAGYSTTAKPKRSKFNTTPGAARDELFSELRRLGAKDIILSSNIPLLNNGLPRATYKIEDTGVAVYFTYKTNTLVLACDKWDLVQDNMKALSKNIEAMRGMERWGCSDMLQRMFTGFTAIGAPVAEDWWVVLRTDKNASPDTVLSAYRTLALLHHPDKGGTDEMFQKVNKAYKTYQNGR